MARKNFFSPIWAWDLTLSLLLALTTHWSGASHFSRPQFPLLWNADLIDMNHLYALLPQRFVVPEPALRGYSLDSVCVYVCVCVYERESLKGTIVLCLQPPLGKCWMNHAEEKQYLKLYGPETSLVVQWLRLQVSTVRGTGLIPGQTCCTAREKKIHKTIWAI